MTIDLPAAREYLRALDLSYLIDTMCASHYPLPRWTREDAEKCCQLYKNFLYLQKKHAGEVLVPTREIDEFWHNHILYTKKYFEDCQSIFGYYLHHMPASPKEEMVQLAEDFLRTKQYYLAEFGEPLTLIA